MKLFIFFSVVILLSSCSSRHHPKMLSFTPASVVIDYSENDLHEATSLAQQFCASIQKDAQYVSKEETGWVITKKEAFFNCVEHTRGGKGLDGSANHSQMPIINNFK
jgi:hypothetical protein